tara:strand:+ start:116 stop:1015 length:900 start_codon:yes stop_codon:yes gene_type:complete
MFLLAIAIGCMFLSTSIPNSEAKLWDFIVNVEFLDLTMSEDKNPILIGTVVDHAYRPVSNVDVKITFAGYSYMIKTNELGEFGQKLDVIDLKPRTYSIHILVSNDGEKQGMTSTTLKIDGHQEKSAKFDRQLEYLEMVNDPSKLRKNSHDPISVILYQHYLELQAKISKAQNEEVFLKNPQQKINEMRQLADDELAKDLEKRPLSERQSTDYTKSYRFLESLDDEKRILFESTLKSTKIRFMEAQIVMQDILIKGGSQDEARQAYLDHLSITQDEMSLLLENLEKTKVSSKLATNSTEN